MGKSEKAIEGMEAQCAQWIDDAKQDHTEELEEKQNILKATEEKVNKMKTEIDSLKISEENLRKSSSELEKSKCEIEEAKNLLEVKNNQLEESIRNLEEQNDNLKKSSPPSVSQDDEKQSSQSKEVELEEIISNQAAELVFFKDKISQLEALQAPKSSD